MQVQVNADQHIEGREAMTVWVSGVVEKTLNRISDFVTRVDVHVSHENGHKQSQNDKRCAMEARLEGLRPIAVTHHATTVNQAVDGAADKLFRLVASTLVRPHVRGSRTTDPSSATRVVMAPS